MLLILTIKDKNFIHIHLLAATFTVLWLRILALQWRILKLLEVSIWPTVLGLYFMTGRGRSIVHYFQKAGEMLCDSVALIKFAYNSIALRELLSSCWVEWGRYSYMIWTFVYTCFILFTVWKACLNVIGQRLKQVFDQQGIVFVHNSYDLNHTPQFAVGLLIFTISMKHLQLV